MGETDESSDLVRKRRIWGYSTSGALREPECLLSAWLVILCGWQDLGAFDRHFRSRRRPAAVKMTHVDAKVSPNLVSVARGKVESTQVRLPESPRRYITSSGS